MGAKGGRAGRTGEGLVPHADAAGGGGVGEHRGPRAGRREAPDVLVVFAGGGLADSNLARSLAARGMRAVTIDVALGGEDHDVTRGEVAETLIATELLCADVSVPLAPRKVFWGRRAEGVLVCTTDASGGAPARSRGRRPSSSHAIFSRTLHGGSIDNSPMIYGHFTMIHFRFAQ